jgi:FtsH-binding integral membrane protein
LPEVSGDGGGREESAGAAGPKRPASVTLVAAVALLVAAYNLAYGIVTVEGADDDQLLEGIFHLAFGAGTLVAAIGAFRLRGWAWAAFMTWAVIGLTVQILLHLFFEDPNYLAMAINTFAVLAMSPLEVQVAFGLRHTRNVQLARPTRNPLDRD